MSFDNSRFTFNSWNDYLGVVMQQGRVQLDSDWNELIAELGRRIQAGTLDILGLSGVPATTPFGFKISASLDANSLPHVTIGAGRIYLHGLLAENHGAPGAALWDPALAEWSGTPQILGIPELDVDFTQQPYLPGAILPAGKGPFIAYLDVWQRAVTYLEDPSLLEKAVGVDTTGRLQTVWQVKLLDVSTVGSVACSTPDAAITPWIDFIQPSASLLTTGLVPSVSSGPCALSPASGYTGLENQLYRVEIHHSGGAQSATSATPATFKWSRENASVATAVTAISSVTNSANKTASQLTLQSLGKDQVLGFKPGDWIEITDDFQELNGQAGELHKIDSINATAKTITLDAPVSSTNFPISSAGQTTSTRHTRILRWDQTGIVYQSDGATVWANLDTAGSAGIPVPPAGISLILENGITVSFNLAQPAITLPTQYAPTYEAGDYWTFTARTADGSVQALVQAPPLGIHHHYCRLGVVDFNATPPQVGDCRQVFNPLANPAIHVTGVFLGSGAQLQNDATYTIKQISSGINVVCDVPVDPAILTQTAVQTQAAPAWNATTTYSPGQPVSSGGNFYVCLTTNTNQVPPGPAWAIAQFNSRLCHVSVDVPTSPTPPVGAYNPVTLSSTVSVGPSTTINWTPTLAAQAALATQVSPTGAPLLARLTLKGNSIWALGSPNVFLNGATNGFASAAAGSPRSTGMQLPSGDGRSSADFEMWFWLVSQPPITLSPAVPNVFAPQLVGTTSAPQTIVLTFSGTIPVAPLTISSIVASGDFAQTNNYTTPIAAGTSVTINVTFTPTTTGLRTGQITITESASTTPIVIPLTGTGLAPQLAASTGGLTFIQTVGTTSAAQVVTLKSTGNSPLTISGISITSAVAGVAADYSETSTCIPTGTGTFQPGQSCTISVQFKPAAIGSRVAQLNIAHNAAGSPLVIALTGTGTSPIKIFDVIKTTDVVKTKDLVKTTDVVKTVDTVKTTDVLKAAATNVEASPAAKEAFITPAERPAVIPTPEKPS
jgi:hypothetical protein